MVRGEDTGDGWITTDIDEENLEFMEKMLGTCCNMSEWAKKPGRCLSYGMLVLEVGPLPPVEI